MSFAAYVGAQFGNPTGLAGWICCRIMNCINAPMYRWAVDRTAPGTPVLDVGCGNGRLLRLLDRAGAPELYGIDISPDMCRLARRRCRRADRAGRLHLTVGSVCGLPYPAEQFAAAVSVNTVYFWPDTVLGLSELCRCLRPGGRFLNVCYTKEWLDALA